MKKLKKWDVTAARNEYNEIECYRMEYLGYTISFHDTLKEAEKAGREFKPNPGDARFMSTSAIVQLYVRGVTR